MSYQPPPSVKAKVKVDEGLKEESLNSSVKDQDSKGILLSFLLENGVEVSETESDGTTEQMVENIFDRLSESLLRSLASKALEQRDSTKEVCVYLQILLNFLNPHPPFRTKGQVSTWTLGRNY